MQDFSPLPVCDSWSEYNLIFFFFLKMSFIKETNDYKLQGKQYPKRLKADTKCRKEGKNEIQKDL